MKDRVITELFAQSIIVSGKDNSLCSTECPHNRGQLADIGRCKRYDVEEFRVLYDPINQRCESCINDFPTEGVSPHKKRRMKFPKDWGELKTVVGGANECLDMFNDNIYSLPENLKYRKIELESGGMRYDALEAYPDAHIRIRIIYRGINSATVIVSHKHSLYGDRSFDVTKHIDIADEKNRMGNPKDIFDKQTNKYLDRKINSWVDKMYRTARILIENI